MTATLIDWKAQQAARAVAAQALAAANPRLVPIGGKVDGLQAAAKNIRIELARAFPGVKFSVKSRRFSMGDAIDVRWTDGPIGDQVDAIVGRYKAGSFDGSDDSYTYSRNAWRDAFGDAKYVHTSRDLSDRALASAIRTAAALYGIEAPSIEQLRSGSLYRVCPANLGGRSVQEVVYEIAYRRTWSIAKRAA